MHCIHCGKNISSDSKFCPFCGKNVPPKSTQNVDHSDRTHCEVCGTEAPVKQNEFDANIGMLFRRQHKWIKGKMCKNCTEKYFWNYTLINLFLGWWGTISFLVTLVYIPKNIYNYARSFNLKRYY